MINITVEKCPVCGGNGVVNDGFYRQTSGQWFSSGGSETCRSCDGRGYVSVNQNTDTKELDGSDGWDCTNNQKYEVTVSDYDGGAYISLRVGARESRNEFIIVKPNGIRSVFSRQSYEERILNAIDKMQRKCDIKNEHMKSMARFLVNIKR